MSRRSRARAAAYRRGRRIILLIKKLLYEQRYTIAGARQKLREMGVGRALESGSLVLESCDRTRFQRIREELVAIRGML